MADFTDVIGVEEVPDGSMVRIDVPGTSVLLARVGDRIFATQSRCPHLGGDLSKGTLSGTVVRCPLHGSEFDLSDGRVVRWTKFTGAARAVAAALRHERPLRVYEVRVENGRVLLGPERRSGGAV